MSKKIGFWSVFALVTGSQIGSGVFMLPSVLAPFGYYGIMGWFISGFGAISLAFVFSILCNKFPKTGGPHVYINEAFGKKMAFFSGWTYWVISWVSSVAVVVSIVGYLTPLIGVQPTNITLLLEIIILFALTALNIKGIEAAGKTEFFLSLLKIIPLIIIPIFAFSHFDVGNFTIAEHNSNQNLSSILGQVTMLTLWGFIGVESATTAAGAVKDPKKTIPRAIILGTTLVALIYITNSLAIMGSISGENLAQSTAPYVDITKISMGNNMSIVISLIASIVCLGTLNAWILASGQIALGLAEDGLMPKIFAQKNKNLVSSNALMISAILIVPLLMLTANQKFSTQINQIIDYSVTGFLFVYIMCCLSLLKLKIPGSRIIASIALLFCSWVIYETPLHTLAMTSLFVLSGIPVYFYMKRYK